tara:strand:- start:91 stop:591 length:501 start_codon:yes stop_codon:yes gene_type:complete
VRELPFDDKIIREATEWAENLGGIYNSITRGDGNFAGRFGELVLAKHLGVEVEDHKDYDLIYNDSKVEVKTKRRATKPKPNYTVNIASTSRHQKPDTYAFLSVEYSDRDSGGNYSDLLKIWLCGYKSADQFFEEAEFWPKGTPDPPFFKTHRDMYVMKIGELDERL